MRTFRVFLSSTFRDLEWEREAFRDRAGGAPAPRPPGETQNRASRPGPTFWPDSCATPGGRSPSRR